ncbi:septation protein SepH [Pseudonocardia sp. NPDC046786]|uniref:septation protein SepH n=1 Tax=Pseudonocardia sp. NPDC046786 TaxID=3155471 RepID=UPI0033C2ECBC
MRALRVVGVTGDGSVVLEDPGRRERYTVPADEQLRAAARGDVTRLGQIAIELESQLRPREIQARIRGGASVDEVAAAAGVPTQKIERFAYPVLLERSRTAELAQSAHPQRADGPDSRTLGETVAHTFGLRGQDFTAAGWDSWKGEDGKWVVVLTWQTGRSDNAAHWSFQPGAHGGTVSPLDEHASDLVEGLPARPLRPLGSVVDIARDEEPVGDHPTEATPARAVAGGQAHPPAESWGRGIAPEQRRASPPPRPRVEAPTRGSTTRPDETRAPAAAAPTIPRVEPAEPEHAAGTGAADGAAASSAEPMPGDGTASVDDVDGAGGAAAEARAAVAADGGAAGQATVGGEQGSDPAPGGGTATDRASTARDTIADATTGRDTADRGIGTGDAARGTGGADDGPDTGAPAGDTASRAVELDGASHRNNATGNAATRNTPAGSAASDGTGGARSGAAATDGKPNPGASAAGDAAPGAATATDTTAGATGDRPDSATSPTADRTGVTDSDTEPHARAGATDSDSDSDQSAGATEQGGDTSERQDSTTGAADQSSRQRGAASRRTKKGKPVMPSWDEVLLGVRGQR